MPQSPPSEVRLLAAGRGWRASEVLCRRGPRDRPFEERHSGVSLGAVLSGTFVYRGGSGRALLAPGAVLLGAAGTCFECGHEHGQGDRCLALQFEPALFDELAAAASGDARFRLRGPMLPAVRGTIAPLQRLQAALARGQGGEEAAIAFAEAVVREVAGVAPAAERVTARDQRRIAAVARHMEDASHEPLDLDALAARATMSKYHFLRCFRRVLGCTPHQWLLQQRLQRAAQALRERREARIAVVAADAGFGDLSEFNRRFRRVFGTTPGAFRAAAVSDRGR